MMLRILGGTVLGAAVLMLWGFLFWDLLLPPGTALHDAPDQPELAEALRSHLPTAGTYFLPHDFQGEGEERAEGDPHAVLVAELRGTIAMIHYAPEGGDPLSMRTYVLSFAQFLAAALGASLLLAAALPGLGSYPKRAGFVLALAVFAIVAVRLTDPIWYRLPWEYFLYVSLFLVVGWAMAAAAIAAVVRPGRG